MTSDKAPYVIYFALAALMVGSSLAARRIPMGQAAKMACAWIAIFAAAFALFSFKSEFKWFGHRLYASAVGDPVEGAGGELRIPMADDGHFWVRGTVNGKSARFLVDSGATVTTLSSSTAKAAGIAATGPRSVVNTANGQTFVTQADADHLTIGTIDRADFPVNVSNRDDSDILGMNFLSSLNSWRVENDELVLRP